MDDYEMTDYEINKLQELKKISTELNKLSRAISILNNNVLFLFDEDLKKDKNIQVTIIEDVTKH